MKWKLPSPKSVAVWTGAVLLALWSLPADTGAERDAGLPLRHPPHVHDRAASQAVPTTAPVVPASPSRPGSPADRTQTQHGQALTPTPANQPPAAPHTGPQPQPRLQVPNTPEAGPPAPIPPQAGTGTPLPTDPAPFSPYLPWPTEKLRVRVIDGRSQQPISGAEVVLVETEQRLTTGPDGYTPWFDAPLLRDPRFRPLVRELHGQLGVIAYKNGYRDSIHFGIRINPGVPAETTVWMYKLGPGDTRIEPVFYEEPYHHIWLVELADRFRSDTQPGEGPERP